MADQVQWRRGTTAETAAFTGAQGEITVDTDRDITVVHDGVTPGGFPTAKSADINNTTIYFDDDVGGGSAADAYILIPKSNSRTPTNYFDGISLGFVTTNPNTGPSTVNFSGLGVKNIKLSDGSDPLSGQIDGRTNLVFDSGNDWFELSVSELSADDQKKLELYKGNNKKLWPSISNNAIDTNKDIDFSEGVILDSEGLELITLDSALTKQLDNGFVPGTGQGGLFSGAIAASTTYHCFLIVKDSDGSVDAGFDVSPVAANIPAGYTNYRRIGSILTDGSIDIEQFTMRGDKVEWKSSVLDLTLPAGSTVGNSVLTRVPTGLDNVIGIYRIGLISSSTSYLWVRSPDFINVAATANNYDLFSTSSSITNQSQVQVSTGTTAEVQYRNNAITGGSMNILTIGFIDDRT